MKKVFLTLALLLVLPCLFVSCHNGQAPEDGEPHSHSFGAWEVVTEPTCTLDGEQSRICTVCGESESQSIPSAHTYGKWTQTKAPTCGTAGQKEHICSVCGDKQTTGVSPTGAHVEFNNENK